MSFSRPKPVESVEKTVEVAATLVKSSVGLSALGPFTPDSWKVVDAASALFGRGDIIWVRDVATNRKVIMEVGRIKSWELGWVKFAVRGAGLGGETHLYAPLDLVRLSIWDRFLHWCQSPWLGDTVAGYFAPSMLSLQESCHRQASPRGAARAQGISSLDLVEDGYGPYRVGVN